MDAAGDWVPSDGSYALDFDGTNDLVDCGNSTILDPGGTPVLSMSAWIKKNAGLSKMQVITRRAVGGYVLQVDANSFVKISKYGVTDILISGYPQDTKWHNLTAVMTGAGQTVYVDGRVLGTALNTANFASSTAGVTAIGGTTTGDGYSTGQIKDAMIWRRAVTAAEVAILSRRPGIAYELAQRRRSSVAVAASTSRRYGVFNPVVLRSSR
jgi:hypothetical protein